MDNTSKSILLQVAFKEAAQKSDDIDEIKNLSIQFYTMLTGLHEELEIGARETGRGTPTRRPTTTTQTRFDIPSFLDADLNVWYDYRDAKKSDQVKPGHPDFKGSNGDSVWLVDRNGDPDPRAAALIEAAKTAKVG